MAQVNSIRRLFFLICGEWGYVPLDQAGSKLLFQVISDCYEHSCVVSPDMKRYLQNAVQLLERVRARYHR